MMDQLSRIVRHLRKGIPWLSEIRNPDIAHPVSCGIVASMSNIWSPFRSDNTLDLSKCKFQNLPKKNSSTLKARFRVDAETQRSPLGFIERMQAGRNRPVS
jgi:hypothetical protein